MLKKTPEPLNLKICKNLSFIVLQSTLKKPKSDLKKYFSGPKMSKIGLDLVKGNILFSFSSVLVYKKFKKAFLRVAGFQKVNILMILG